MDIFFASVDCKEEGGMCKKSMYIHKRKFIFYLSFLERININLLNHFIIYKKLINISII